MTRTDEAERGFRRGAGTGVGGAPHHRSRTSQHAPSPPTIGQEWRLHERPRQVRLSCVASNEEAPENPVQRRPDRTRVRVPDDSVGGPGTTNTVGCEPATLCSLTAIEAAEF